MYDDQAVICPNPKCNESRFKEGATIPRAQMACVSVGRSLTQMLLDDDTRELFNYKNNFDFNDEQLVDIPYPRSTTKIWWDSDGPAGIPPRKRRYVCLGGSTPLDFSARGSTNVLFS